MSDSSSSRKFWQTPWGYGESFLIGLSLVFIGFLLEYASGGVGINALVWPHNISSGIVIVTLILGLHLNFRKKAFIRWFGSIPAAISSITMFAAMSLLLGFIPQKLLQSQFENEFGFDHLIQSWPFIIAEVYFLFCLGFSALRHIWPLNFKNIGYVLNHVGLWIVVFAASLGSGDLMRLNMTAYENKSAWVAVDKEGNQYQMPIALELKEFKIDEYEPKLFVIDNKSFDVVEHDIKPTPLFIKGNNYKIGKYDISVLDFIYMAQKAGDNYHFNNTKGASPAAKVNVTNSETGQILEGWVTCGSFGVPMEYLVLDSSYSLVMNRPEPKKYSSRVQVYGQSGVNEETVIEVNKPYKVDGWNLYQLGYDTSKGRWSEYSIIEFVKDPWLPAVYVGIFMMLAGAVMLYWSGKRRNE